jgi:ArsR family transcriptional regulator, cadmium/lead-responsive transcriptional repressor
MLKPLLYSSDMAVVSWLDLSVLGRIGTALADPTRRRILVHLIDGPAYPTELADEFDTTRANLSNHLTCLRECGLVTATAEGRRVRYDLANDRLAEALRLLASLDLPGHCD